MFLLSAEEMRSIDVLAIDGGIPQIALMENAATATVGEILKQNPEKVIIFAGKGQNAGDGFAIARRLFVKKIAVEVVTLFDESALSGAAAINFAALKNLGVKITPFSKNGDYTCSVLVDCILGTGVKGTVSGDIADAISLINTLNAYAAAQCLGNVIDARIGLLTHTLLYLLANSHNGVERLHGILEYIRHATIEFDISSNLRPLQKRAYRKCG